jgi:threonyl-tRNA synthetase
MIHRALLGSFERFIGILVKHYGGELPLWLAPVQVAVLPIADRHLSYAREVAAELRERGLRVDVDERSESVGKKVREAELRKVPYMLVVGDREQDARQVAVRRHREGDVGTIPVAELARRAREEIEQRR